MTDKIIEAEVAKKPVVMFTAYDAKNADFARKFKNSLRKFHSEEELPLYEVKDEELAGYLKLDPMFWYRQKPVIAQKLMKEYEVVIGMDCDQIVVGDLSYIWKTKDYDVGTVINYNRADIQTFPPVGGWGIIPIEYFNCGLVAMRSEVFAKDWMEKCLTPQFERLQFKEQDILNALCYYGRYNVRCFDHMDKLGGNNSWWGLLGKGEFPQAKLVNNEIIIPKGDGETPFPPKDVSLKVIHFGGGQNDPQKGNYKVMFQQEVVEYLDKLVS